LASGTQVNARYTIVPGHPRADKAEVLAFGARNWPPARQEPGLQYRKWYETNPLGPPTMVLAREVESQALVGTAARFPTRLRVSGGLVPAAIGGDFAVEAGHRGFGPAIALQRALVPGHAGDEPKCVFGSPNAFSEPVLQRVGYVDLGRFTGYVKVLRSQPVIDAYVRRPRLARLASSLGRIAVDPMLSLLSRERLYRRSGAFRVEEPELFDERFQDVWDSSWRRHRITSERNPELLNWKYNRTGAPESRSVYSIFALLARDDKIAAYIVYRAEHGVRHLYDVLFRPSRAVLDALLAEFILDSRRRGAAAITLLYLGPANLLTGRLRAFGFLPRRHDAGMRLYVEGELSPDMDVFDRNNWYLLSGDSDV
jgi:hypothetical protein